MKKVAHHIFRSDYLKNIPHVIEDSHPFSSKVIVVMTSKVVFDLGESLLNGIEIWRVGGQVHKLHILINQLFSAILIVVSMRHTMMLKELFYFLSMVN